ncbi:hypothetical protein D3C81_1099940 [compost metagenome]
MQDDRQLRLIFTQLVNNAEHVFGFMIPINDGIKVTAGRDQLFIFMAGNQGDTGRWVAFAHRADGRRIKHQVAKGSGRKNNDTLKGQFRLETGFLLEVAAQPGVHLKTGVCRCYFPLFRHLVSLRVNWRAGLASASYDVCPGGPMVGNSLLHMLAQP